jgi:3-oxoacyl-[acyl-carrier-protein] synthase-3
VRGLLKRTGTKPSEVISDLRDHHARFRLPPPISPATWSAQNIGSFDVSGLLRVSLCSPSRAIHRNGPPAGVVGADKMSTIIDYTDRATCVLFGDGAGAVLLEPSTSGYGIMDALIRSDGAGAIHLHQKAGGSRMPASPETVAKRLHSASRGAAVYKYAIAKMAEVSGEIMTRNNLRGDQIDWLVPHQANKRIIESTAERMGLSMDKVMVTIHKYGNTTNATIPLCLWDYEPQLKAGNKMVFAAFGGGFTWAGVYVQWAYDGASAPKLNGNAGHA